MPCIAKHCSSWLFTISLIIYSYCSIFLLLRFLASNVSTYLLSVLIDSVFLISLLDSRTLLRIMDQRLIFAAMMLLILPSIAALGKNAFILF